MADNRFRVPLPPPGSGTRNDKCWVVIPGTLRDRPRDKFFWLVIPDARSVIRNRFAVGDAAGISGKGDASEAPLNA